MVHIPKPSAGSVPTADSPDPELEEPGLTEEASDRGLPTAVTTFNDTVDSARGQDDFSTSAARFAESGRTPVGGLTVPGNALSRPVQSTLLAQNTQNINGFWLGGPVVRVSDGVEVGPQRPAEGLAWRGDVRPTEYDSRNTSFDRVPAVEPRQGVLGDPPTVIYVNGIDTNAAHALDNAQDYADRTGRPVRVLYNANGTPFSDVVESGLQKLGIDNDRAVRVLADTLLDQLDAGESVALATESQGAIIARNAINIVRSELLDRAGYRSPSSKPPPRPGQNEAAIREAESILARISVETYGGAASSYPDGPRYVHYINEAEGGDEDGDAVAEAFGLGWSPRNDANGNPIAPPNAGRNATILYIQDFDRGGPLANHVFTSYLDEIDWLAPERLQPGARRIDGN